MSETIAPTPMVESFLTSYFHKSEMRRVSKLTEQSHLQPSMDPNCRAVVLIPAYYQEQQLAETLLLYMRQETRHPFEVAVLVNAPAGVSIEESQAWIELAGFRATFPDFPITAYQAKYQREELTIGRVRRDLAAVSLRRAEQAGLNMKNLLLISNDADALDMPSEYIQKVVSYFDGDSQLAGLTGFCEYPRDLVRDIPFLFILQRFMDTFEIIQRYKDSHMVFHSANSIHRAADYMDVGGYRRSRIAEGQDIYKLMARANKRLQYSRAITITTSPRRQVAAFLQGVPQAERYDNFGTANDFHNLYAFTGATWKDLHQFSAATMDEFAHALEEEIHILWGHRLFALYLRHSRDTDRPFEEILQFLYTHDSERIAQLEGHFIRAAQTTGLDIDFQEGIPRLKSMDRFFKKNTPSI